MSDLSLKLKPCPAPGEGVHKWLCYVACTLVDAGWSNEEAEPEIEALMTRDPKRTEIKDALRYARGERGSSTPRWAPPNAARITAIAKNGPTLLELVSRSPIPIRFDEQSRTEETIDALFPSNPWLCVGRSDDRFFTARRQTWRGHLHKRSLIVPSPMSAKRGRTKEKGKLSFHSESNTGSRRFLVIEFDGGSLDQQAAILWHLAQFAPLALVVFSGSKSCHGWFFCANEPEDKLKRFFDYAHSLGADPRMWGRSQFTRLPDGERSDGKTSDALRAAGIENVPTGRQAILYFNPEIIR